MSNICAEERPTSVYAALMRDNITIYNMTLVSNDLTAKFLSSDCSYIIKEDTNYVIAASFSIFAGDFYISTSHSLRKYKYFFQLHAYIYKCSAIHEIVSTVITFALYIHVAHFFCLFSLHRYLWCSISCCQ